MTGYDIFGHYIQALRKKPVAEKTEHTDRSALEALLNTIATQAEGKPQVQHEPKRVAGKGAPDFKVTKAGLILGYVENKAIGENLSKVLKSEQIAKYKSLSRNILLTDYLEFVWIGKDGVQRETLCHETDLEDRKARLREDRVAAVTKLLQGFFSTAPEGIGRSQQLALALATRSRLLRDYLGEELIRQEKEHQEARLYGLFQTFRTQIFHELTPTEFADAFAQMLAYGLFLARLNAGVKDKITLNNAREHVPGSFRLIHELVEFLTELTKPEYQEVRWVVEEVLSIVNGLDLAAIQEDLSFRQRKAISRRVRAQDEEEHRLFERDPFIYFYEDYLKAYDKDMRKGRGVYYTPPPVVNFIVRAVDDILKDSFGIKEGLADHKRVTVLDFACGTGTFLLEIFQRIFENIGGAESGRADLIVREHILKNLYGFEYLIAPYTIAHLKLSQYLKDRGHPLKDTERLQVFLTNTLEPVQPQRNLLLPAITAEVEAAQKVKDRPILVITGNPPYSGVSKNMGDEAQALIDRYKFVDGRPLGEKKQWLQDDYVKFIAFGQKKMESVVEGVMGIITNHAFISNPTFRGMRQSLMGAFNEIYILNLHGNSKRKERAPNGSDDQNVFDIQQGVCISVFVKKLNAEKKVYYADVWGSRIDKYKTLANTSQAGVHWSNLQPTSPFYFLMPFQTSELSEYENGFRTSEIFRSSSAGIVTARDHLVINYTVPELQGALKEFGDLSISDQEITRRYGAKSNYQWKLNSVRKEMSGKPFEMNYVRPLLQHPFDKRFLYNDPRVVFRPRHEIMGNMVMGNVALVTNRSQEIPGEWTNAFVADCLITHHSLSMKEVNHLFPLYLYSSVVGKSENFSPDFRAFLDARYDHHYSPEEIMGYIYAVLHAPAYRTRYAEFLRIDFPRIPFPEDAADFEALSKLGWALIEAHLLREVLTTKLAQYHGKGDHMVEGLRYAAAEQAVWINKTQCFKPVPEAVWNFHIGGYQVLEKYLKSRKGRTLSLDEINHVAAVAASLAFTGAQMAKIDKAYGEAFPAVDKPN